MNDILSAGDTKRLEQLLAGILDVPVEQLVHDAHLKHDLGADSLTLVEIAMAIDEEFNLVVPDECWERTGTVGEVFEAVAELMAQQKAPRH